MLDLDDTIEDIDVGEHRAVLGWGRPRWFQAHILHLYAEGLRLNQYCVVRGLLG